MVNLPVVQFSFWESSFVRFDRLVTALLTAGAVFGSIPSVSAQVLFQQFYYPIDKPPAGITWWQQASSEFAALSRLGVYAVWHPVPTKGGSGAVSMGYDPYDLYDLGSKNQKGTVRTNFGTKDQYLAYIATAHSYGIRVYADVVLNHAGGADFAEDNPVMARLNWDDIPDDGKIPAQYRPPDYNPASTNLRSWTRFLPVGADGQPGTGRFTRSWKHFHPSEDEPDRDEPYHKQEFGPDYAFFADGGYVAKELIAWGLWFKEQTGVDGMRLDAVKLIDPPFIASFAEAMVRTPAPSGQEFYLVGEFWDTNPKLLSDFQTATQNRMSLFDFGLFYALWDMTEKPKQFDMRDLLKRRFADRQRSVSFVSNHDVDRFQPISRQKRALPYAITLTMSGQPSLFYLDYFRPEDKELPAILEALVRVHNRFAKGPEIVRFADGDLLAIERSGNLLGVFNDGGSGTRTVTLQTAFGRHVSLVPAGLPLRPAVMQPGSATPGPPGPGSTTSSTTSTYKTDSNGRITVKVPAGGYLLLVRADATDRTHPDRFALRPLSTTQVHEFADDLDTGRLGNTTRVITVRAAAGTLLQASLRETRGEGSVIVEIRNTAGKIMATYAGQRGRVITATVRRLPADDTYRILLTLPGPATTGKLRVTYTAPR